MPSPVGHSLFGYAVFARWKKRAPKSSLISLGLFLLIANLPDIDLAFGLFFGNADKFHHQFTHSFVFCALSAVVFGVIIHFQSKGGFLKCTGIFFLLLREE